MQGLIKNCYGWEDFLKRETEKPYFKELERKVEEEYEKYTVFPPYQNILRALELTPKSGVKVVILGQDPYHEKGQATGLAFSVNEGVKLPPSLRNIYKEIADEYGVMPDTVGDLEYLAKQGVLLLNTTLTVREGEANSHKNYGWEKFTDSIILETAKDKSVVFILWGSDAIKKQALLKDNITLTSVHPSPLSAYRGFFGCGHFKKANEILKKNGKEEIRWVRKND